MRTTGMSCKRLSLPEVICSARGCEIGERYYYTQIYNKQSHHWHCATLVDDGRVLHLFHSVTLVKVAVKFYSDMNSVDWQEIGHGDNIHGVFSITIMPYLMHTCMADH